MRNGLRSWVSLVAMLLGASIVASPVHALVEIQKFPEVVDSFQIGGDLSTFFRWDHYPYYNNGPASFTPAVQKDNSWGEIFGRLRFQVNKKFDWAETEMQIAPVFLATIDQDVYGLRSDETDLEFNQAYIKLGALFGSPFTLTVGMQDIQLEKQMMIGLGRTQGTSLWLLFNQSFPFAARVDGDFGALKSTAFWARSGQYFAQTFEGKNEVEVAGINLHWDILEGVWMYGGFYTKMDDTPPGSTAKSGNFSFHSSLSQTDTQVVDLGGDWTFGPFNIEAEAVYEFGDVEVAPGEKLDRDSFGFFVSPKFTLPIGWSPYIKLHYIFWPGDDDLDDGEVNEYDPMFEGWTVWNRWFIGEQTTECWGLKTNTIKYIGEVGFYPVETCQIQFMYIRHQLDEEYFPLGAINPIGVHAKDWSDEINVFMNWQVNGFIFLHTGLGWVNPLSAAKEVAGSDKDAVFAQAWLMFAF